MDTDRLIGRTLGNFKLLSRLGQGGMGVVYLAEHQVLRNQAAVKVLPPAVAQNQQYRDRFFREARSAFALRHPNIVGVLDAGYDQEEGICYFAMELCEGRSLQDRLRDRGPMPLAEALPFFRTLANAFHFAHSQGFIHRDIKPDNVMFDRDGVPKITDFGLARAEIENTRLTATGQVMGTPAYMSIEQWEGETLNARADQYSLGVLFYEALTCRLPIQAPTAVSYLTKLVKGARIPITSWRTDLPAPLVAIVEQMTAIRAPNRYASLAEVAEAFAQLDHRMLAAAQGRPTSSMPEKGRPANPRTLVESAGRATQRGASSRRRPAVSPNAPTVVPGASMLKTREATRGASGRRAAAPPTGRALSDLEIKTIVAETRRSTFAQIAVIGAIVFVVAGAVVLALALGNRGSGGGNDADTNNDNDNDIVASDLPNNVVTNEWANSINNGTESNTPTTNNTHNAANDNRNTPANNALNNTSNDPAPNNTGNTVPTNNAASNSSAGNNANSNASTDNSNNASNNAGNNNAGNAATNNAGGNNASSNQPPDIPDEFRGGVIDGVLTLAALPADGAYVIEEPIEITPTGTLMLEAGATLMFRRDVGLTCFGSLIINGSEDRTVAIHGVPNNDDYAATAYIHLLGPSARGMFQHASFTDVCGQRAGIDTGTLTLTIPGSGADPVFGALLVHDGATLECVHCGFHNCAAFNYRSDGNRGGALMAFGRMGRPVMLTLNDCLFIGNYSTHGGGICLGSHVTATLDNVSFEQNECDAQGGAVFCEAYEAGHRSTFINCGFQLNNGHIGGALMVHGQAEVALRGCVLNSNEAVAGGGIWANGEPGHPFALEVDGCSFEEHYAQADGGAIGLHGGGTLNLQDTTFTNNVAVNGGAIGMTAEEDDAPIIIARECGFQHNAADEAGGAISIAVGSGRIEGCTFHENVAGYAGGGVAAAGRDEDTDWLRIHDCTFQGNNSEVAGGSLAIGNHGRVEVTDSRFFESFAVEVGGAIAVAGDEDSPAELRVTGCEAHDCYCEEHDSHILWVSAGNRFDRGQLRANRFDEDEVVIEN